jgi:hypothetical protein
MVVVDLLVDGKPTTTIADEGASLFGRQIPLGWWGFCSPFQVASKKCFFLHAFFKKHFSTCTHEIINWTPTLRCWKLV